MLLEAFALIGGGVLGVGDGGNGGREFCNKNQDVVMPWIAVSGYLGRDILEENSKFLLGSHLRYFHTF